MLTNNKTYKNNNLRDVQKVFNDGVCEIYSADERIIKCKLGEFRVCKESVGVAHYYHAHNNNITIDYSISIPYFNIVINSQNIVKYDGTWYKIARVQYRDNKKPHYWTLSLTRSPFSYVEDGNENG